MENLSQYVAYLRALYLVHQNNHWGVRGKNFYSNHLMLQRLYEGVQEMADEAAEKCIGVFGELNPVNVSEIANKYLVEYSGDESKYLLSSLRAEQDFQKVAKQTYDALKKEMLMTLGLDDMIMSHASKSEVHTYLLNQAIKP